MFCFTEYSQNKQEMISKRAEKNSTVFYQLFNQRRIEGSFRFNSESQLMAVMNSKVTLPISLLLLFNLQTIMKLIFMHMFWYQKNGHYFT